MITELYRTELAPSKPMEKRPKRSRSISMATGIVLGSFAIAQPLAGDVLNSSHHVAATSSQVQSGHSRPSEADA